MKNYSYVTLLTSDEYINGVLLLKESLRSVNTKYPLLCIATKNLSDETFKILIEANIKYKVVDQIPVSDAIYNHNKQIDAKRADIWRYTFTKFIIWTLEEYEKIIFLDADLLILKNLDHCFEYPELTAAVDGERFNLWPNNFHFNSGFMVLEPKKETFNNLINFAKNVDPDVTFDYLGKPYIIADQDILNMYFKDWKNKKECQLDKYYNVFAPYILKNAEEEFIKNAYFIHFVGLKPWQTNDFYKLSLAKEVRSSYFFCLGLAIISCSVGNNYKDLDWSTPADIYVRAARIAMSNVVDLETCNMFITNKEYKDAFKLKDAILTLVRQVYENNVSNGLVLAEDVVSVEIGTVNKILEFYDLFEKAVIEKYKNY